MAKSRNSSVGPLDEFLDHLVSFESDMFFNPWRDNCLRYDSKYSNQVRLRNLKSILFASAECECIDLWIGRDLGWRGGRRTGVPLVDECSLTAYGHSLEIDTLTKATIDLPMKERTATEVHLARARVARKIFFWNVFPFHPHESGNSLSNRMHTRSERKFGEEILTTILELLPFERVISIGKDANDALSSFGIDCRPVRHPSYGGQKEFHQQINDHYEIEAEDNRQPSLFH